MALKFKASKPQNIIALAGMIISLLGCSQSDLADLEHFVSEEKSRKNPPVEPAPEIKLQERFLYQASSFRDPFKPTVVIVQNKPLEAESNGVQPNEHRRKEVLETFKLAELKFVGVLERGTRSAMIRDVEGIIHLVQVGNYMGENNGKIIAISDTEIQLKEIIAGTEFAFQERENVLVL